MHRLFPVLALVLGACGSDTPPSEDDDTAADDAVTVEASSFRCITDLEPVRRFYVDNLLGDLDATLDVARDPEGRTYPTGTLIQLVPTEAMVKREPGFAPEHNDWEFFFLGTSPEGTTIEDRGVTGVINAFGGDCLECHQAAKDWDYVCETDHGCVPLPLTDSAVQAIQAADPRCGG